MTCTIVSAGIDYVTLSGRSEQIYGLQAAVSALINALHSQGERTSATSAHGYTGWRIGPVAFLDSGEYGYCQASGDTAGFIARVGLGWDVRCTRLDAQVTVTCDVASGESIGDRVYREATLNPGCPDPSRIQSPGGRETVYIGSRMSDRFARVYTKDKEDPSGGWPSNTWRYEVEVKKPRSQTVWRAWGKVPQLQEEKQIIGYVSQYFTSRGLYCPFNADTTIDDTVGRKNTPIDRKLAWLSQGVSPTILDLFDRGYAKDVLIALGVQSSPVIAKHILAALKALGHTIASID